MFRNRVQLFLMEKDAEDDSCHLQHTSTPPKFNSSPLKNGGWKTILSYWVSVTFQGLLLLNFGRVGSVGQIHFLCTVLVIYLTFS